MALVQAGQVDGKGNLGLPPCRDGNRLAVECDGSAAQGNVVILFRNGIRIIRINVGCRQRIGRRRVAIVGQHNFTGCLVFQFISEFNGSLPIIGSQHPVLHCRLHLDETCTHLPDRRDGISSALVYRHGGIHQRGADKIRNILHRNAGLHQHLLHKRS